MLREIIRALKRHDALVEMVAQVGEMLDADKWMFEEASQALLRAVDWSAIADELYARDRQVNAIEQKVREGIVVHQTLGPKADLSACLVLMNVVKDAERIGDYCKNIFEVAKFFRREFTHPEYSQTLEDIRKTLLPLFDQAREAFTQARRRRAKECLDVAGAVRNRCDVIIRQLLSVHDQLAPDEAVAYVLLARFYKRVASHLANISTSVISPVPLLDYRGKLAKTES